MRSAPSLDDSLRLVFPDLPEELVPANARQRLSDTAKMLAPIHCAGFECRLGNGNTPVDLQQRILARDDEPARLASHIAAGPLARWPVWQRVRSLCREWQRQGSALSGAIGGCWLELDAGISEPSVFLSISPLLGRRRTVEEVLEIGGDAAELLTGKGLPRDLAAVVRSCVEESPSSADATDIGFMLGRGAEAVRLVIGPFQVGDVASYLRRIGERTSSTAVDSVAVENALATLPQSAEQILISLDIADSILPRVGLEHFPGGLPGSEALWGELLDALVEAGLCTTGKRAALMRWPGYLEPCEASGPWPDHLVVESLLRGTDRFSVLGRRLNHVKIVSRPDSPPEAKAYFGFGPLWLQPGGSPGGGLGARDPASRIARLGGEALLVTGGDQGGWLEGDLRAATVKGLRAGSGFLLDARDRDGLWLDFESVVGGSDTWVSAYVGTVFATLPGADADRIARQTWGILRPRLADSGGWSYNSSLPADADATAWALRLARAVREQDSEPASRGRRFLGSHVLSSGGIASYTASDLPALRRFVGDVDTKGLCVAHDCVTAAAAVLPSFSHGATAYLMGSQRPEGCWEGYWWCDHEYATALATEALLPLARNERPPARGRECLEASGVWACTRLGSNGAAQSAALSGPSPFATALCCRILLESDAGAGSRALVSAAVEWLLSEQLEDGSWEGSAVMRVPPTHALAPAAAQQETFFAVDRRRVFTTATVLWTLGLAQARLLSPGWRA
jgi:hypothetical protein